MGVDMMATVTARIAKNSGVFGWNISDTSPWRNSLARTLIPQGFYFLEIHIFIKNKIFDRFPVPVKKTTYEGEVKGENWSRAVKS